MTREKPSTNTPTGSYKRYEIPQQDCTYNEDQIGEHNLKIDVVPDSHRSGNDVVYAEETPLTWIFGNHPEVKLLAAFLSEPDQCMDKKTAAELSNVSRPELPEYLDPMIDCGVVKRGPVVGKVQTYKLGDIKAVSTLRKLEEKLVSELYKTDREVPSTQDRDSLENKSADFEQTYAEDTPLTWICGDHPEAKLIAGILSEPDAEISVSDWKNISGVSRGALNNHRKKLIEHGVVNDLGKHGRKHLYELADNQITGLLRSIESQLLRSWYKRNS